MTNTDALHSTGQTCPICGGWADPWGDHRRQGCTAPAATPCVHTAALAGTCPACRTAPAPRAADLQLELPMDAADGLPLDWSACYSHERVDCPLCDAPNA